MHKNDFFKDYNPIHMIKAQGTKEFEERYNTLWEIKSEHKQKSNPNNFIITDYKTGEVIAKSDKAAAIVNGGILDSYNAEKAIFHLAYPNKKQRSTKRNKHLETFTALKSKICLSKKSNEK